MPTSKVIIAIVVSLLICSLLCWVSIEFFGDYGWTLFLFVPLIIGFLPPYIAGQHCELSRKQAYSLSFRTLLIFLLGFFVIGIEGLICIIMVLPVAALLTWLGSFAAHTVIAKRWVSTTSISIFLTVLMVTSMGFDRVEVGPDVLPVSTTVVVDAPIDIVWNNVVTFDAIAAPSDWIFKTGIAYPTDATIEGNGVGAVRYCNFTTGSFVEPITNWDEPYLLQFDVEEQPVPMNEFNPFWDVHPQHLDGYFTSHRGQFKLTATSESQTSLEGTTWYDVDIRPEFYWRGWSDFIIHRIHKRVLTHIKAVAERDTVGPRSLDAQKTVLYGQGASNWQRYTSFDSLQVLDPAMIDSTLSIAFIDTTGSSADAQQIAKWDMVSADKWIDREVLPRRSIDYARDFATSSKWFRVREINNDFYRYDRSDGSDTRYELTADHLLIFGIHEPILGKIRKREVSDNGTVLTFDPDEWVSRAVIAETAHQDVYQIAVTYNGSTHIEYIAPREKISSFDVIVNYTPYGKQGELFDW